jgi:hypothetical protein
MTYLIALLVALVTAVRPFESRQSLDRTRPLSFVRSEGAKWVRRIVTGPVPAMGSGSADRSRTLLQPGLFLVMLTEQSGKLPLPHPICSRHFAEGRD